MTPPPSGSQTKYVFVVAMENESSKSVYGSSDAPYLNGLIAKYAHATAFNDPLPDAIPSEPHYVWMEAGTNQFSDTTFTDRQRSVVQQQHQVDRAPGDADGGRLAGRSAG